MEFKTSSVEQTQNLAQEILDKLNDNNIICFFGPMGSGKTVLAQSLARKLAVKKNLVSPTFILVRQYMLEPQTPNYKSQITKNKDQKANLKFKNLWHVDLYRLNNLGEIKSLGIEEIWEDKSNLVLIEWAEKAKEILPPNYLSVKIEPLSDSQRRITID